jgi:hypothetical protein
MAVDTNKKTKVVADFFILLASGYNLGAAEE